MAATHRRSNFTGMWSSFLPNRQIQSNAERIKWAICKSFHLSGSFSLSGHYSDGLSHFKSMTNQLPQLQWPVTNAGHVTSQLRMALSRMLQQLTPCRPADWRSCLILKSYRAAPECCSTRCLVPPLRLKEAASTPYRGSISGCGSGQPLTEPDHENF